MLKKPITWIDFNGNQRTEDFYFNFTEAELVEMELGTSGGMVETMEKIVAAQDSPSLVTIFKDFILKAYGEKSSDGRSFLKEDDNGRPLANKFKQTGAYSVLFTELSKDANAAAEFMNKIIPADLAEKVKAAREEAEQKKNALETPKDESNN